MTTGLRPLGMCSDCRGGHGPMTTAVEWRWCRSKRTRGWAIQHPDAGVCPPDPSHGDREAAAATSVRLVPGLRYTVTHRITMMKAAMPTRYLSLRIGEETFHWLEAESRRTGKTRSALARMLLEEGRRREAHPGIVFRPGPGGRRPGLAGGPDVLGGRARPSGRRGARRGGAATGRRANRPRA